MLLNRIIAGGIAITISLHAADEPKTLAEVNKAYKDPGMALNAALHITAAAPKFQVTPADKNHASLPVFGKAQIPKGNEPLNLPLRAAINEWVKRNEAPYADLLPILKLSQSRYPIDLTKGLATLLPHLSSIKTAAQGTHLFALHRTYNNKPGEAGDAVAIGLLLSQSLEQEPYTISQLVRVASLTIALQALEQVVNRTILPTNSLEQLQTILVRAEADFASGAAFNRCFLGEKVTLLSVLDSPVELGKFLATVKDPGIEERIKKSVKSERAYLVKAFDDIKTARAASFPDRIRKVEAVFPASLEVKDHPFANRTLPAMSKAGLREAHALAKVRVALTALALERHRAEQGKYPTDVAALSPKYLTAALNDPFTGEPIAYSKSGDGYSLKYAGRPEVDSPKMDLDFTVAPRRN